MSNIQVGDAVVCVNVAPTNDADARRIERLRWLTLGKTYTVRTVGLPYGCIHLVGDGLPPMEGWLPWRFSKAADEQFTDDIRELRPIKQPVSA